MDEADNWIAERARAGDIVITADVPLASRCVKSGANVIAPNGRVFSEKSIGMTLATRNLMDSLRSSGEITGGPKPFAPATARSSRRAGSGDRPAQARRVRAGARMRCESDKRFSPAFAGQDSASHFHVTIVTISVTFTSIANQISLIRTPSGGKPGGWGECGARGRSCDPLPGSFGHQPPSTTDWAARCSLDWDRSGRVTPAQTASVLPPEGGRLQDRRSATSQEAWPGAEPWG